ncbi:asparaginase [uncultured Roseobacter sp.]|uniref:asparaginase n=1 Tax=uncultured Roseobacter sp. TaxID=114847 RepID=UPI002634CED0|nr:asparaginase [uncultured Roseobacter sp.]
MIHAAPMVEIWRGEFLESAHAGHAVVCDASGDIVEAWGDADATVLPRSSAKMIQALPLITSGAADRARLTSEHLALACASHNGAAIHTDRVADWLETLALDDDALRCGPQMPDNRAAREGLIRGAKSPCQIHNNCSGKHTGFLTLAKHLGAGPEYIEPDHPVQTAALEAFETVTDETSPGFGIDGCSAPNFACTLRGMARAMAQFAAAPQDSPEARLHEAMRLHPDLVAGEGRACTELMRAMDGKVAIKTGAEAFFTAILPDQKLGIALKITDGSTRASECAIAAILVKLGVLEPDHPATRKRMNAPILNRRKVQTGWIRPAAALA